MQVEIGRYREVNKGALKAFFELFVPELGMKVIDCQHFQKGDQHWFNWPSKEHKKPDGTKSYFPYLTFAVTDFRTKLENAIKEALKNAKPTTKAPSTEPESIVQGDASSLWF